MVRKEETTMKEVINVPLKQCSNTTLLDMYYEYRKQIEFNEKILMDSKDDRVKSYYSDKNAIDYEYFTQIKLEILSRMMGMDID